MTKKPTVMHVVECFGGGVIQSIAKICHATKDSCNIIIAHSRREQTPDDYASLFPKDVTFVPWHAVRQISPADDFKSLLQLKNIVNKYKPDVLHLHSSKAGAIGRIAFPFGGGMKVLYSPRAYGFLQVNLSKSKVLIYRIIENILGYTNHITVACGKGEYRLAKDIARKSDLICNSVDLEYLAELSAGQNKFEKLTVVSSGRISYQKDFPLFVKIAASFENEGIDFVWAGGEVPEDIVLPDNVRVTGWISQSEAIRIVAKSHIYIQTSLWEGLSLTVLEAMGLGLPVVIRDAIGNTEMVDEGIDGFICSTPEEYAHAITKLRSDAELRNNLGKNALTKISRDHNNKLSKNEWIKMYTTNF